MIKYFLAFILLLSVSRQTTAQRHKNVTMCFTKTIKHTTAPAGHRLDLSLGRRPDRPTASICH